MIKNQDQDSKGKTYDQDRDSDFSVRSDKTSQVSDQTLETTCATAEFYLWTYETRLQLMHVALYTIQVVSTCISCRRLHVSGVNAALAY